ncbi:sigma-70 family RNA polymerase sigma factor [Mycolicibacterium sp. XJ1819]
MTAVLGATEPDTDRAARFACEAAPFLAALSGKARRLTRNQADAEDLLQDALMHAYVGFDAFADGTNLKAWLFRILYNRWVSGHRARQRRPAEVCVDEVTEHDLADSAARSPRGLRSAESEALDALGDNEIRAAMSTLPEGFRIALYYTDIQGYTYAETAELMRIPMGTVMSRVARARKRLRLALAHRARGGAHLIPAHTA